MAFMDYDVLMRAMPLRGAPAESKPGSERRLASRSA